MKSPVFAVGLLWLGLFCSSLSSFPARAAGDATALDGSCADPLSEPQAYAAASLKMMKGMERGVLGDADRDFVRMMIPHYEGSVEMAKIQLKFGKDPALRALAGRIVKTQGTELEAMKAWLAAHPDGTKTGVTPPAASR